MEARFLTAAQAAERLARTPSQLRHAIEHGKLRAVKIGGAWRIPIDAVEWLELDASPVADILSPVDVARALRLTPATVRSWARTGKLHGVRTPAGQWRFRRSEVDRYLNP